MNIKPRSHYGRRREELSAGSVAQFLAQESESEFLPGGLEKWQLLTRKNERDISSAHQHFSSTHLNSSNVTRIFQNTGTLLKRVWYNWFVVKYLCLYIEELSFVIERKSPVVVSSLVLSISSLSVIFLIGFFLVFQFSNWFRIIKPSTTSKGSQISDSGTQLLLRSHRHYWSPRCHIYVDVCNADERSFSDISETLCFLFQLRRSLLIGR